MTELWPGSTEPPVRVKRTCGDVSVTLHLVRRPEEPDLRYETVDTRFCVARTLRLPRSLRVFDGKTGECYPVSHLGEALDWIIRVLEKES